MENEDDNLYILNSIRDKFDKILILSDYLIPLDEAEKIYSKTTPAGRIPSINYDTNVNSNSYKPTVVLPINKKLYVKIKELDLGENNAYFVVGKLSWYYLRDFHNSHIGLRGNKLDWQIVHLDPFTMGTNKFVFCHSMIDEFYDHHIKYFFDDKIIGKSVLELPEDKIKILHSYEDIKKYIINYINLPLGTRFGLDYETNGLYRNDKYEDLLVIGVGIATKKDAIYLEFRDLKNEKEFNELKDLYREFLKKHEKNIWVFNNKFEIMATRKLLNAWDIYEFMDTDIWRIIYGNQIGYSKKLKTKKNRWTGAVTTETEKVVRDWFWNLKFTAQKYLNIGSWDNEFEYISTVLEQVFHGKIYKSIDEIITCPIIGDEIHSLVNNGKINGRKTEVQLKRLLKKKTLKTKEDIKNILGDEGYSLDKFSIALLGVKEPEDVKRHYMFMDLIKKYGKYAEEFEQRISDPRFKGNEFSTIPTELVGKYCIKDSYYTLMIAEKHLEEDKFTPKTAEKKKNVGASDWVTTEKLAKIFNDNKVLGSLLDMYGLYKSNTKRLNFNNIQLSIRIFTNWIVAKGYYNIKLNNSNLSHHPNEALLKSIFRKVISIGEDPTDFNKITKYLFKLVYDPTQKYNWSDKKALDVFGEQELADTMKEVLLEHQPKGFKNESAFSRSINIHNETGTYLKNEWESQNLPKDFSWIPCKKYYDEFKLVGKYKILKTQLDSFNFVGKSIDEIISMENISYIDDKGTTINLSKVDAVDILKSKFYDIAPASELKLGLWFENNFKNFKILFSMYANLEYRKIINDLNIFNDKYSIETKIEKFHSFIINIASTYSQPNIIKWQDAHKYALDNNFPKNLLNTEEFGDMEDKLISKTYIEKVISQDLVNKFGVTKSFMDSYMWFNHISEKTFLEDKEAYTKYKGGGLLTYKSKTLEKANMLNVYDLLNPESNIFNQIEYCNVNDNISLDYYPLISTAFKLYRKADKIGQYLNGQLIDFDNKLIGEDEDLIPKLSRMSKIEQSTYKGNDVKMFPLYEIMLKFTKRNSAGIHTVPSSNEIKGTIVAPDDSFLIYTDISSMELRGIAAIAKDKTMIKYFEDGKDIYTEAAVAYHNGVRGKQMLYNDIRKEFRKSYKTGVIATIYTASDRTLARQYDVEEWEVRLIKAAIFDKFKRLYDWQQEQINYNKKNRGYIRTYLGDIRKTYDSSTKQNRQAVNADVQGTCSLIATSGFKNIITEARKKRIPLVPAIAVHDAIIAYSKVKDIEILYDHYQESFYNYLDSNYGFRFPFDLEVATNYFDKIVLERSGENSSERRYTVSGTHKSLYSVLSRAEKYGKKIEFIENKNEVCSTSDLKELMSEKLSVIRQYLKSKGVVCFDKDFSYGKYDIKFVD